ncbi:LuxR C-terminal-related transcriptional regulator [Nocardia cyriacigeorgica]|uniref:LuxR C-terminal-related transcriptional regulator n=1 Tax=Nocardia cyriacigeorgica TaxID=135487 RepID=UPI00056CB08D|nr:LuxR C-terminal-related transcriptional regulator [Nocardia cyriacigeorgica]AVH24952.1 DNA-binding response regulator [Nocardia cyriacigeorgica]PPJ05010.1 DNA-binding response regulator [Nocardia cyriacigeorgica]TLF56463.1 response regulator transcription factor [Nocardia cyriacigeorgica]
MTELADIFEPGSLHGRLYALLVHHPRSRLSDIADHLDVSEAQARCALDRLCEVQAAVRLTDNDGTPVWDAHAPEALSEAEARRRQQEIATMHAAAARLSQTFRSVRRSPRGAGAVVPVYERLEMLADFEELQVNARRTVKVIERGPFLSDVERERRLFELKQSRIGDGIRYRTLYQDTIYQDGERLRHALATNARGASARTLPEPPFKLIVADDERASLVLHADERRSDPMGLRITRSPGLELLVKTFDVLWSLAAPISVHPAATDLDERDRAILTLMGLGATDDTIARRLGMSRRTVVRRTARLLERLGASTRFQAGVQAIRRGWL